MAVVNPPHEYVVTLAGPVPPERGSLDDLADVLADAALTGVVVAYTDDPRRIEVTTSPAATSVLHALTLAIVAVCSTPPLFAWWEPDYCEITPAEEA